ncbi:MAG: MAPEG family protein [Paraglaciecola sp.]|uniref:MAPEG family protein n=1 Tax=Pseudomonadati TaxID=3379134 RepID=UPI00273D1D39|nr:MAPEG family protein [Paraglaciecola sp.]MDP5032972.1 MAPEG family protein [Paraglaciecola sp.]MDP5133659.1 MAPEG family protein [Paraglaciecola sp.]
MTLILTCLLIATIMPILAKAPLALAQNKQQGGYDNRHPRSQQNALLGFGARAKAAHENCFEALIMFMPGALALIALNQVGPIAQYLCVAFVVARIAYLLCYWFNYHLVRSICWSVGFFCSVGLLILALI